MALEPLGEHRAHLGANGVGNVAAPVRKAFAAPHRLPGRAEWSILALLAAWTLIPLVVLISSAAGGEAFTGTAGPDPVDTLQYLAWIRESGMHGLSSNLFGMTGGGRVFLQPMYLASGLLWRLGLGLPASYLVWVPVSVGVLWAGFSAYARNLIADPVSRMFALVVALFFITPLGLPALATARSIANGGLTDVPAALQPWLAPHAAIAVGLLPLVLIGIERILEREDSQPSGPALVIATTVGAALVSWLHSWQGETLLLIMLVAAVGARRRAVRIAIPAVGAIAPLLYMLVLTRTDVAWRILERNDELPGIIRIGPLMLALGPLLLLAIPGFRRSWRGRRAGERMLCAWPAAALVVYGLGHEFPPHALQGITLPLAVLAIRAWPRGRLPVATGAAMIVLFTVPGLAGAVDQFSTELRTDRALHFQSSDERAALAFLAGTSPGGGVLAPWPFALQVPAFSGHPVWDGHWAWSPSRSRPAQAEAFFAGRLDPARARQFIRRTRVRWILTRCANASLNSLGPMLLTLHQFGCVDLAEVAPGHELGDRAGKA